MRSATHTFRLPRPLFIIAAVAVAMLEPIAAEESPVPPPGDSSAEKNTGELDLRAPDLTKLYTREQIDAFLVKAARDDDREAVEVEGTREHAPTVTPKIWSGIATPFWALLHPMQAWRIFMPIPPDQTRGKEEKPDATNPDHWPDVPLR